MDDAALLVGRDKTIDQIIGRRNAIVVPGERHPHLAEGVAAAVVTARGVETEHGVAGQRTREIETLDSEVVRGQRAVLEAPRSVGPVPGQVRAADLAAPPVAPGAPVVVALAVGRRERAPASAVGPVVRDVVVPRVRSVAVAVVRSGAASPSGPSVKSSSRCRLRRSVASPFPVVTAQL